MVINDSEDETELVVVPSSKKNDAANGSSERKEKSDVENSMSDSEPLATDAKCQRELTSILASKLIFKTILQFCEQWVVVYMFSVFYPLLILLALEFLWDQMFYLAIPNTFLSVIRNILCF